MEKLNSFVRLYIETQSVPLKMVEGNIGVD